MCICPKQTKYHLQIKERFVVSAVPDLLLSGRSSLAKTITILLMCILTDKERIHLTQLQGVQVLADESWACAWPSFIFLWRTTGTSRISFWPTVHKDETKLHLQLDDCFGSLPTRDVLWFQWAAKGCWVMSQTVSAPYLQEYSNNARKLY